MFKKAKNSMIKNKKLLNSSLVMYIHKKIEKLKILNLVKIILF
jgi:hypothetical protein